MPQNVAANAGFKAKPVYYDLAGRCWGRPVYRQRVGAYRRPE